MTPPDFYAQLVAERYGLPRPLDAAEVNRLGGVANQRPDDEILRLADYGWTPRQIAGVLSRPLDDITAVLERHGRRLSASPESEITE